MPPLTRERSRPSLPPCVAISTSFKCVLIVESDLDYWAVFGSVSCGGRVAKESLGVQCGDDQARKAYFVSKLYLLLRGMQICVASSL